MVKISNPKSATDRSRQLAHALTRRPPPPGAGNSSCDVKERIPQFTLPVTADRHGMRRDKQDADEGGSDPAQTQSPPLTY